MKNTPSTIDSKIEEGGKEMGVGLSHVISGTCGAIKNAFLTGVHAVGAGISKIQEKFGDKNLIEAREKITQSHVEKLKKSGKKTLKGAGTTLKGGFKTVKGTGKVAVHSVRKTVKDNTEHNQEDDK